jgi:HEPN domain-containing protein
MPERSADWMRQAEKDLTVAQKMHQDSIHEWSCFIAQQAAEKAIKSVYQKNGGTAWGHSLKELLEGLKKRIDIPPSLENDAATLDKYYVPARYPNGFGSGSPFEYFTNEDSNHAISSAGRIIQFCKGILAR